MRGHLCLVQFQLLVVNRAQRGDIALLGGIASALRRTQIAQMDIFDPDLAERGGGGDFEKPGRRDDGNARTSISLSTPACFNVARKPSTVAPS